MSRTARLLLEKVCYHVINRGNQKQPIFLAPDDYGKYLGILKHYKTKFGFCVYAYCLMPNHVHFIMEVKHARDLAKIMQGLTQTYSIWFNHKYRKPGRLWQGRFKSFVIEKDKYLLDCLQYIELNPVRANLVTRPEDYLWSSWKERLWELKSPVGHLLDVPERIF